MRHSKVVRRLLLRSLLFVLPGTALWALLPLVATRRLGLGSGGYGLLLAALGVGAVAGAVVLPRISARLSTGSMIFIASIVYAAAQIGIVLDRQPPAGRRLLLPAGAAWLAVLSSLGAATQVFLPGWVRARGLSMQQIVFMGGQAVGALVWGLLAQYTGLVTAFAVASALMALGATTIAVLPLHDTEGVDRTPAVYWPEPQLVTEPDPDEGPVLITLTFTVPPDNVARSSTRCGTSAPRAAEPALPDGASTATRPTPPASSRPSSSRPGRNTYANTATASPAPTRTSSKKR